jgi:hypothetical protein
MQPLRPLDSRFDNLLSRSQLALVSWLQPRLRSWYRCKRPYWRTGNLSRPEKSHREAVTRVVRGTTREEFLESLLNEGWSPAGACDTWDLEKDSMRLAVAEERWDNLSRSLLIRTWRVVPPSELPSPAVPAMPTE